MIEIDWPRLFEALFVIVSVLFGGRSLQVSSRSRQDTDDLKKQLIDLTGRSVLFEQRYNETNEIRLRQDDKIEVLETAQVADRKTINHLTVKVEFIEGERVKEFQKYQDERDGYMRGWGRLEEKLANMEARQKTDGEKITALETKVRDLESDKRQLEQENKELLIYKANCAELTVKNERLQRELDACQNTGKRLEERIVKLEAAGKATLDDLPEASGQ